MSRNPYLLLGVDYGVAAGVARRAFARAANRVRAARDSDVTVEELTSALHEIQAAQDDPFDQVEHFRVPADPDVFGARGTGVLNPAPVPAPRRTPPPDPTPTYVDAAREIHEAIDVVVATRAKVDYGYAFVRVQEAG